MPKVKITVRGQVQEERDVDRDLMVGRKAPADIVVADGEVSSKHVRLRPNGDGVMVTDLGSTNGCTIDGGAKLAPNSEASLAPGQKLRVGPAIIEIVDVAKAESSAGFGSTERTVAIGGGAMQSLLVNVARFKAAQPRLVIASEHEKRTVPIDEMEVVVGRDAKKAQVVVQHQSVSGAHAKLKFENGRFFIEDLKSANGTFLDGNPVAVLTPVQGEQALTFGTVDCLFVQKSAESAAGGESLSESLCNHIVRLGKATQQQAKDVLSEHRTSGASLGQLFVERGILAPKEWAEIYRQRQIIDTIGSAAGKASTGNSKMMAIAVAAVVVIAVVAYFVFLKK